MNSVHHARPTRPRAPPRSPEALGAPRPPHRRCRGGTVRRRLRGRLDDGRLRHPAWGHRRRRSDRRAVPGGRRGPAGGGARTTIDHGAGECPGRRRHGRGPAGGSGLRPFRHCRRGRRTKPEPVPARPAAVRSGGGPSARRRRRLARPGGRPPVPIRRRRPAPGWGSLRRARHRGRRSPIRSRPGPGGGSGGHPRRLHRDRRTDRPARGDRRAGCDHRGGRRGWPRAPPWRPSARP